MVNQINVHAVPDELTTAGFMKVKEANQDIILRFLMAPDFRGKLVSVSWNLFNDDKVTTIEGDNESDAEQWSYFNQVGERPEIDVPSTWLKTLGLSGTIRLRIKFEFDTFRQNPDWYAYLYIKDSYGDLEPPYAVPNDSSSIGSSNGSSCCNNDCADIDDETDDSLV